MVLFYSIKLISLSFPNNEYLIFSNFLIKHFHIILRQNQTQLQIVYTLGLDYVKLSNLLTGPYVLFSSETWAWHTPSQAHDHQPFSTSLQ